MPPTMLRNSTAAVVFVLFLAVPLTQTHARSRADLKSASNKGRQIDELEQRLREPYGPDTWFVFAFATVQPDFSGGVTIGRGRHHRYGYAQMRAGRWYDNDYYAGPRLEDPIGAAEGSGRVTRGGSWLSDASCLSWDRYWFPPAYRNNYLGFRVALVPSASPDKSSK